MNIPTENYIGNKESREVEKSFRAFSPSTNEFLTEEFAYATPSEFQLPTLHFPDHLLPDALKNSNPLNIPRLVNGKWEHSRIKVL
ncbi:hypothetical protein J2X69_003958 [Algoriphagus sp. 4150]|uniref:hypothetical protein n=1 Tax=Algoriphagus sp. 4150 TaxID=2817756 RepID=UPI00285838FA|nr:hypothetical protein [Algoriphagus sp. 4150]MDR7131594.1 hypothetical protein [Algoriphagus sp. 4150]